MTSEISVKDKADLLKGSLSYKEHYDYLMEWYLNDRKHVIPHAEMHESLKDVLEALKELNAKVESGANCQPRRGSMGLFESLVKKQVNA